MPRSARPPRFASATRRSRFLGRARMYVCGITPYETTHVGHAATFVWADVAARVLRLAGATVEVCRNVTDVDDHMLAPGAARRRAMAIAGHPGDLPVRARHGRSSESCARRIEPRSRDYVNEVVALAADLLANGAAYERNGSVYFRGADVARALDWTERSAMELARRARRSPRRSGQG